MTVPNKPGHSRPRTGAVGSESGPADPPVPPTTAATPDYRLVPLTPDYAHPLAICHIACWREAYRGIVPDHVLDAFDVDRRAEQWERIAEDDTAGRTTLAVSGETVLGFAGSGPPRDTPAAADHELYALYVRAHRYGTGLAHALIHDVLDRSRSCSLWVFERNPRARAFYTKYGFIPDGTARAERFAGATEMRMIRPAR